MSVRPLNRACKLVVANTVGSAGTVRNSTSTERNGQRQIVSTTDAVNTRTTDAAAPNNANSALVMYYGANQATM